MNLREIENYGFKILNEKSKDGSMTIYAKFAEAEKRNQNSRIYPLKILSREVDRVQSKIASGQFLGQQDHSDSPATFLKDVSHVVTGLEMKGNEGYATIKILNTDAGKNCQEIIRGKGRIGISTRSVGTVDAKTGIIQSDLKLLALDLVSNPSVKDATIGKENILEGRTFEEEDKMFGLSENYVQKMIESIYGTQVDEEFFVDSLEEFRKKKEALIRAEILCAHGHFETTEQALEHLGEFEEAKRISAAPVPPVQKRVTPNDVYFEAKMAGIDPKTYADKLNASLEEKETSEAERSIRTEIERAGRFSEGVKLVEKEEIYPDGEKRRVWVSEKESPQQQAERIKEQVKGQKVLTEDERAEAVAEKFGTTPERVKEIWAFERKRKQEEKKRLDKITFSIKEQTAAGFGSETRPEARKRSKKIIEGE